MPYEDFEPVFNRLCLAFEKTIRRGSGLAELYHAKLAHWPAQDWTRAVEVLIGQSDRRTFPRIGECLAAMHRIAEERIDREGKMAIAKEAAEWKRFFATPEGQSARAQSAERARSILAAMTRPATQRKEALAGLRRDFEEEAAATAFPPPVCSCDGGLVFVAPADGAQDWVGRCGGCQLGRTHASALAIVDPQTLRVLQPYRPGGGV